MKIYITHIISNNAIVKSDIESVDKIINKHAKKASSLLPFKIKHFTFTIYAWEKEGISAFTQAIDWVDIKINFQELFEKGIPNKNLLDQLIYIVYHEMHHACRRYAGILPKGKDHILIDSVLSEGLADHFAIEQYPTKYLIETKSFDLSEIGKWIHEFGKVMWDKESEDDSWLYGGREKPTLLGYKIGRYVVHEIKQRNPKLNSVNLIHVDSKKIVKLSGISF